MTAASLCEDAKNLWHLWNTVDPDGDCDGPAWLAYEAAETAALRAPCETIDDVRAKARFVLENGTAYDSVKNCFLDEGEVLTVFLRSLLGEVRQ
jgi:hypothetical protein